MARFGQTDLKQSNKFMKKLKVDYDLFNLETTSHYCILVMQ